MRARVVWLLAVLAAACAGEDERRAEAPPERVVPGLETALVAREAVRDVVRAYGTVAAAGEPAEVRDARTALAEAEARQRLATQQVARLEALARGAVAPRKELEAARAEEAGAAAAAAQTRAVLAAFGTDAASAPLAAEETWVLAQLLQLDVARVGAGAGVRFVPDALRERAFAGRMDAAPAYVDPATQAAPVRVRVQDPERVLRPGMTGAVAIEAGAPRDALVVPAAAVVWDGARPVVFVAEGEGRYAPRPVALGVARDGRIEVTSGLEAGARVVTTGAASLLSAERLPAVAEED